jgi:hypothetical protein
LSSIEAGPDIYLDFEPPKVLEIHEIESWFHSQKPALEKCIHDAAGQVLSGTDLQTHSLNTLITQNMTAIVNRCLYQWLELDIFDLRSHAKPTTGLSSSSMPVSITEIESETTRHTIFANQKNLLNLGTMRRNGGQPRSVDDAYSYSPDAELHTRPKERVPAPGSQSPSRVGGSWTSNHQTGYDIPMGRMLIGKVVIQRQT